MFPTVDSAIPVHSSAQHWKKFTVFNLLSFSSLLPLLSLSQEEMVARAGIYSIPGYTPHTSQSILQTPAHWILQTRLRFPPR